ncbi:hypothetical protein ACQP2K_00155 [Microbispora siamensis]
MATYHGAQYTGTEPRQGQLAYINAFADERDEAGRRKAGCERAVQEAFEGAVTVLRPGVILGRQENVGRLTWWLRRIARGGRVLAPGQPAKPIQPVDIRDLTAFTLSCLQHTTRGVSIVTAPKGHATFGEMLGVCRTATGSQAELTWVDDDFLIQHDVRQWTEIPLWRTPEGPGRRTRLSPEREGELLKAWGLRVS